MRALSNISRKHSSRIYLRIFPSSRAQVAWLSSPFPPEILLMVLHNSSRHICKPFSDNLDSGLDP
jgi:hypothetical protein